MPYCNKCGAELSGGGRFCPRCGAPVTPPLAQASRTTVQQRPMSSTSIAVIVLAAVLILAVIAFAVLLKPGPATILGGGSVVGSGNLATHEENFTNFTTVALNSGFKFVITQSNSYGVRVTADDNLFNYIQVSEVGGTLSIGIKPGYSVQPTSLEVEVTMPDLNGLELNGGTSGVATGFNLSHDFSVSSSGGSVLTMKGQARNLAIDASGGSRLDLSGFHANDASVNLNGGSQATVDLDGRLDCALSGGAHLVYLGNPTMGNISTSGGATLSRR